MFATGCTVRSMDDEKPVMLRRREAAAYLDTPLSTFDRWVREKKIVKYHRAGVQVPWYSRDELDALNQPAPAGK